MIIQTWFRKFILRNYAKSDMEEPVEEKVLESAKEKRREADKRISNMIAQINGCGDRWFLKPMESLDECGSKENNR